MQIHSLSKILIMPLVLAAIAIVYYAETAGNRDFSIWVLVPGILFAALMVLSPQIDFWYRKRNPGLLDKAVVRWLERYHLFYNQLNDLDKKIFRDRLNIYLFGREFKSVGSEVRDVPDDIQGIIASIPIMLTLNRDDYLMGDYDRIYIYKHAFPSPVFQFLHTFELNREDGMIILSLEHLLAGMVNKEYYNVGVHVFAMAYLEVFEPEILPSEEEINDQIIETCMGIPYSTILATSGYNKIDNRAALITCFFTNPKNMMENYPDLYEVLSRLFYKISP